jgi:CubicO group peptidase (beta-lactamase class C family)
LGFQLKDVAAMSSAPEPPNAVIAELSSELDQLAIDAMADWKVPGASLAVEQDGKVALLKAYGQRDIDANLPVAPSTQFLIGSITKTFTATAVALLHNEGRLDWTKPVRDYIPEFWLHHAVATDQVTVRDLLCHQTGLPRPDWVWMQVTAQQPNYLALCGISSSAVISAPPGST